MTHNTRSVHIHKVFFELTRGCNLACTHCLNDSGRRLPDELSPQQVLVTIHQLGRFGVREIRFTGGEPTISSVLVDAIRLAREYEICVSIGTNAFAINRKRAQELSAAGLQAAIVSIDGDEQSHDAIRGEGSYCRTWRGVDALVGADISVRINAVAMRTTCAGLPQLADACEVAGVKLFVRRFIPSGRMVGCVNELMTTLEYRRMRESLQPYIDRGVVDGHYLDGGFGHCSAGSTGMVILPNGNVQSCGFLSDLGEPSYGHVAREQIAVIWDRIRSSAYLACAASSLASHNESRGALPHTNCLAIAVGTREEPVHIRRRS